MKKFLIDPNDLDFFPTRPSPPKQDHLDRLAMAFSSGDISQLPEIIVFETPFGNLTADGNHRTLMSMLYGIRSPAVLLREGEEYLVRKLRENGRVRDFIFRNHGAVHQYIIDCRERAIYLGYKNFQSMFDQTFSDVLRESA